ncbi:SRPBCC family protein [Tritonibacter scottomollicae]|uniref:SRPBCC family protein n=1 Tax=Tritonibacter scottomollicae TaxID=483013 RepID=UPI003BA90187
MTADLKLELRIDQTPETCFDLWTHPEQVAQWWGPKDDAGSPFKATVEAWSMSPGEEWAITMTAPDGTTFSQRGKMLEVDRPHRLGFTFAWVEDERRGPETEVRVTFEPDGSGTRLIFEQLGFADEATRDGHVQGWQECLDRLATLGAQTMEVET